jgi:hypothetical protein
MVGLDAEGLVIAKVELNQYLTPSNKYHQMDPLGLSGMGLLVLLVCNTPRIISSVESPPTSATITEVPIRGRGISSPSKLVTLGSH